MEAKFRMERWKKLQCYYFAMHAVQSSELQGAICEWEKISWDDQKQLLLATLRHPRSKSHPPSLQYRTTFLKYIIKQLENVGTEVCDALYEDFGELMATSPAEEGDMCFKTYITLDGSMLSLKESKQLISKGTTGLRTWQAAQFLAEWAMENKDTFKDKEIVELGSGLGFTGLVVCQQCSPKSYTFTDCHPNVMDYLIENIETNCELLHTSSDMEGFVDNGASSGVKHLNQNTAASVNTTWEPQSCNWQLRDAGFQSCASWQHCKLPYISVSVLDWETLSLDDGHSVFSETDIILAADVVYDPSIIPPLVKVLSTFLHQPKGPLAYIASTVRNESTRDEFLSQLDLAGIKHTTIPGPQEGVFIYDKTVPIQLLKLQIVK